MSTPVRTGVAAAARCLALDQLGAEVIRSLQLAGVSVVLLKGAGLAHRLYPDNPDRRRYCDVDLLVAPSSFEHAQQVLTELGLRDCLGGLRADELHWHERLWRRPGPGSLAVDLHRGFAGVGDPTAFWDIIFASTDSLELSGVTARVPDAAGCALVVGLHAARPGLGRKALSDLAAALALLPDRVWDQAADLARRSHSSAAFARGLSRDPAGVAHCVRLGLHATGSLADDLVARGVYGAVLNLAMLVERPGARAKLRHIAGRIAPSPAFMRYAQPLAGRGTAGLAAAYVLRFGRIAREAPRAVLAVGRAQRTREPARRQVVAGPLRMLRAAVGLDSYDRLTCGWTVLALRRVRRQLAAGPLDAVALSAPPRPGRARGRSVERVLAHQEANCMERALVRQRWLAGQGIPRDLVIGVSAPGSGFRAHAWLEGGRSLLDPTGLAAGDEHHHDGAGLVEIHRRPTPERWLAARNQEPGAGSRSSSP